ncbi:MAG: hypothetical protein R3E99_02815 [Burkholderiaceae bacterium]
MAAAVGFIPVYGQVLAFITVYSMLADQDIPAGVGEKPKCTSTSGAVVVNTVHDEHGGGRHGGGLDGNWPVALKRGHERTAGRAPAQHLPTVGYYYDRMDRTWPTAQGT